MNDQGKASMIRGIALGLAGLGLAGLLAGCADRGGVKGDGGGGHGLTTKPSMIAFQMTIDPAKPVDAQITFDKNDGDVWLDTVPGNGDDKNRIIWTASSEFEILFAQIDDQSKEITKKLGKEDKGWNKSKVNPAGGHILNIQLDEGKGQSSKEIRGAKYIVRSPPNCDSTKPGPSCAVVDPIIIVRY
jgi:hypothetical protein